MDMCPGYSIFIYVFQIKILRILCLLLLGSATTLAFAPYHLVALAILTPALLIIFWSSATPKQAFWQGLLFGFGFFSTSVWWVIISMHEQGHLPPLLTGLLAFLFFAYLSLFPALTGWLAARLKKQTSIWFYTLLVPSIWVLTEWLRATLFTGFPWMILGVSQTHSVLKGLAPLIGSHGISLICLMLSGGLAYALQQRRISPWIGFIIASSLLLISSYYLSLVKWTTPKKTPLSISLIQGNIQQQQKWDPTHFFRILSTYEALIYQELGRDLIILPESALPAADWYLSSYLERLSQLATMAHSDLIVGVPSQTLSMKEQSTYFNALHVLGLDKDQYYHKRHLVPFGEYLFFLKDFRLILNYLNIPMSSFIPGLPSVKPLTLKSLSIKPLICYEIAYSYLVYEDISKSDVILVVNDDSWFGDSPAAAQHLQIAIMRAIETRRPLMFESNTGITATVNAWGEITAIIPINEQSVLRTKIDGMQGRTPITRYGDQLVLLFCGTIMMIALGKIVIRRLWATSYS